MLKIPKAYYSDFRIQSIKQAHDRTDTVLAQYYVPLQPSHFRKIVYMVVQWCGEGRGSQGWDARRLWYLFHGIADALVKQSKMLSSILGLMSNGSMASPDAIDWSLKCFCTTAVMQYWQKFVIVWLYTKFDENV